MAGNLGMPKAEKGALQFNINYDLNVLNTLKQESQLFDENNRARLTHSFLFEAGYTFSSKFAVDILLPYIRQEREIINADQVNFTFTQGIGDIIILPKYQILPWVTIGYGIKTPTGSSDKRNNGIALNADLQPGSGAWDHIIWSALSKSLEIRPSITVFGNLIYRFRGTNKEYLGNSNYRFGNEIQVIGGISNQFLLGNKILEPSIRTRFRKAQRDEFNEFGISSSGGMFIFMNPGLTWRHSSQIAIQTNWEFPVFARVNEIQLTPTHRLNVGVFLVFGGDKISFSS